MGDESEFSESRTMQMYDDNISHFASKIDSMSTDELKLALLRAIDHARRCSAEVVEQRAVLDETLSKLEQLQRVNKRLQESSSDPHPLQ